MNEKENIESKSRIGKARALLLTRRRQSLRRAWVLSVSTGIEKVLTNSGNVYYADGALHAINYPSSAVITIYSLLGQNVFGYLPVSGKMNVSLPSGIYLIKVQSEGKAFSHKVIVK